MARRLPSLAVPLLAPAIALAGGIVLGEWLWPDGQMAGGGWLLATALLVVAVVAPITLRTGVRSALLVLAAANLGIGRHQLAVRLPADHIAHATAAEPVLTRLEARIVTTPQRTPGVRRNPFLPLEPPAKARFVVEAIALRTGPQAVPIRGLTSVGLEGKPVALRPGQHVELTGWLYRPPPPRNPGEPDWSQLRRWQGIRAELRVPGEAHLTVLGEHASTMQRWQNTLRAAARRALLDPIAEVETDPESGPLLDALVLGQRSAVPRALDEAFVAVGAVHYLSVSGFHVGVLAVSAWFTTRRLLRLSMRPAALIVSLTLLLYLLLAEPDAPIVRATIMGWCACAAVLLGRPLSLVNWLALSAGLILVTVPLELFRAGFQLSFLQVLVLCTLLPPLARRVLRRDDATRPRDCHSPAAVLAMWVWRVLVPLTLVSLLAWLAATPLVALHFGQIQPYAALFSVLLAPLMLVITIAGFVTTVAGALSETAGWLCAIPLNYATSPLLWVVRLLAQTPGASTPIVSAPLPLALVAYGTMLAAGWLLWPRNTTADRPLTLPSGMRVSGAFLVVAIGAAVWWGWQWTGPDRAEIHVLAVGDGSAALVVPRPSAAVVIDAGTRSNFDVSATVAHALRSARVARVDALLVSHADLDHYSGVPGVLRRLPASQLLMPPPLIDSLRSDRALQPLAAELTPHTPRPVAAGDQWQSGPAHFRVLWPLAKTEQRLSDNDASLVVQVEIGGVRVLFPGDIERIAQRELLTAHAGNRVDLRSDVLIAPHHGAVLRGVTAEFVRAVQPRLVIVSAARPRPRFAELLRDELGDSCQLVETARSGAVRVTFDGAGGYQVFTLRSGPE